MLKALLSLALVALVAIPMGVRAQDGTTTVADLEVGVHIIMIANMTPEATDDNPLPPSTEVLVSFKWPAQFGGVDTCKLFAKDAAFWRPSDLGDLYGVMNCVDVVAPGSGG